MNSRADERRLCVRRSRVVLASVADVKPAEVLRAEPGFAEPQSVGDGDKKEFVAGKSTKETVKTIARGKPGDFRRNRGDYRVLTYQCTRAAGAPGTRLSLLPLSFEGYSRASLGLLSAPRDRGLVPRRKVGRGNPGLNGFVKLSA